MTYELAFIGAMIGLAVFCAIVLVARHEHHARLGRMLLEAAGSESAARMAIESAHLNRLLEQKYSGDQITNEQRIARMEPAEKRRATGHRLPANVVRLVPRGKGRGREVHFSPDGDAA